MAQLKAMLAPMGFKNVSGLFQQTIGRSGRPMFALQQVTFADEKSDTLGQEVTHSLSTSDDTYKSRMVEFSSNRSRDLMGRAIDIQHDNHFRQESAAHENTEGSDSHIESYDSHGNLSLHSAMQTMVPEPFNTQGKRSPTHLNMPGGHLAQGQKYLADDLQKTHYQQNGRDCSTLGLSDHDGKESEEKLSQRSKLKRAVKEYGSTVVVFHVSISLVSLGGFYLGVSSGIDMTRILAMLPIDSSLLESNLAAGVGTFALAYAVHKVFAPVRIAITLAATPFIVHYLRRVGVLKPPKK